MGPRLSSVAPSSKAPWRLTRPQVGLMPVRPLAADGKADRAAGVGADGAVAEARRGGDARARRGGAGPGLGVPRVDRHGHVRVVARIGALRHGELAEDHGAGRAQPRHDRRVLGGAEAAVDRHAGGGRRVAGPQQVLDGERHAVERAAAPAGRDLAVGGLRLGEGALGHDGLVSVQRGVERGDAVQHRPRQLGGGQVARGDPLARLDEAEEGEIVGGGAHSASSRWPARRPPPPRRSSSRRSACPPASC